MFLCPDQPFHVYIGCGHCKNLKPEWDKAATTLKEEEASEKLTALDATKYSDIANRYKVEIKINFFLLWLS